MSDEETSKVYVHITETTLPRITVVSDPQNCRNPHCGSIENMADQQAQQFLVNHGLVGNVQKPPEWIKDAFATKFVNAPVKTTDKIKN